MSKIWIVLGVVVVLVVGIGVGIGVGIVLSDDDGGAGASTQEQCDEARAVVDASRETMRTLNESENQDSSFFAALIVEQRTITYAMDAEPGCFTLQERAADVGLLEGIHALLDALGPEAGSAGAAPQDPGTTPAPDDSVPADSSSIDE